MSKDSIENLIENERPTLSSEERLEMLRVIKEKVTVPVSIPSPYLTFIYKRTMPALIIVIILALGTAGTVAASESAKPGDLLFSVERLTEKARLALANEVHGVELRTQFAKERLAELQEIISEEATNSTSTRIVNGRGEERISVGVNVFLDHLEELEDSDERLALLTAFLAEIDTVSVAGRTNTNENSQIEDTRIHINDDRVEVQDKGYRVNIGGGEKEQAKIEAKAATATSSNVEEYDGDKEDLELYEDMDSYLRISHDEWEDDEEWGHEDDEDYSDDEWEDEDEREHEDDESYERSEKDEDEREYEEEEEHEEEREHEDEREDD